MVRASKFRALCLALPDVEERPHFDRAAFRTPARIFATLAASGKDANLRLPAEMQHALLDSEPESFSRLAGAWGAAGWVRVELARIDAATCAEILREAHQHANEKKPKKKRARR